MTNPNPFDQSNQNPFQGAAPTTPSASNPFGGPEVPQQEQGQSQQGNNNPFAGQGDQNPGNQGNGFPAQGNQGGFPAQGDQGNQGGFPAQGDQGNQGGFPAQGDQGNQGGFPAQGQGNGFPNQGGNQGGFPAQGQGNQGNQGGFPAQGQGNQGGFPNQGGNQGGFPAQGQGNQGGFPNQGGNQGPLSGDNGQSSNNRTYHMNTDNPFGIAMPVSDQQESGPKVDRDANGNPIKFNSVANDKYIIGTDLTFWVGKGVDSEGRKKSDNIKGKWLIVDPRTGEVTNNAPMILSCYNDYVVPDIHKRMELFEQNGLKPVVVLHHYRKQSNSSSNSYFTVDDIKDNNMLQTLANIARNYEGFLPQQ